MKVYHKKIQLHNSRSNSNVILSFNSFYQFIVTKEEAVQL